MCNCKLKEQSQYQEQDKERSSWSNWKTTTKKKNLKNYMKKIKKGCVHCIDTPCKVELCVEPLLCNSALWIAVVALAASSNEKPRTGLEQKCIVCIWNWRASFCRAALCNGAESIDGVACTAVAMGGIQWRGVDHIPGSGDIWAQVISHKHTQNIDENVQTTNTTQTQAHTNTNIHKQQL